MPCSSLWRFRRATVSSRRLTSVDDLTVDRRDLVAQPGRRSSSLMRRRRRVDPDGMSRVHGRRDPHRDARAAVRGRIRRHVGIAVDGEAAQEVARVVEDPVEARRPCGRRARRRAACCRSRRSTSATTSTTLPSRTTNSTCRVLSTSTWSPRVARGGRVRDEQPAPERRVGDARARQALDLLERVSASRSSSPKTPSRLTA